ncbi:fumarylacetoacetate hydrolase family protein [Rhodococcus sp. NPDC055112]
MRFASVNGRAKIVKNDKAVDVYEASGGKFGPSPATVYDQWQAFTAWAAADTTEAAEQFDPTTANSPTPTPRQVFGIGLNYQAHQIESGLPKPEVPLVFTKFPSSITGAHGVVALPTDQVDWEVEMAVVIGALAVGVNAADAWSYVAGVTAAQDFSARDVQMRPAGTPQFSLGKSFAGFTPMGPVLITPDEFPNPDDIAVSCDLNETTMQSSSTADLIFSVGELIEYLSAIVTLLPGDVILTGTPSGVGLGQTPNRFLTKDDQVVTRVDDLVMKHTFAPAQG